MIDILTIDEYADHFGGKKSIAYRATLNLLRSKMRRP